VRIPPPEGFTEAYSRSAPLATRFIMTEDEANEVLTGHLPDAMMAQLKTAEDAEWNFYTKVSVNRSLKAVDATQKIFDGVVTVLEQQTGGLLDPNGPIIKKAEKETGLVIKEPKYLGSFEKGPNVFSLMMIMNIESQGKPYTVLVTVSFLSVNSRFINAYVARSGSTKADVETLRDFTKKWTASIIAANK